MITSCACNYSSPSLVHPFLPRYAGISPFLFSPSPRFLVFDLLSASSILLLILLSSYFVFLLVFLSVFYIGQHSLSFVPLASFHDTASNPVLVVHLSFLCPCFYKFLYCLLIVQLSFLWACFYKLMPW